MDRVAFFIDGFNIYHSLNVYDIVRKGAKEFKHFKYREYLWLDLYTLAERFTRKKDILSDIHYFTAFATWKPHSMKRHKKLIDALENRGVNVVMGKFKEKDAYCKKCGASFKEREEKQTDVNIAVYLFREAFRDNYDTAVILTSDTDLVPAIVTVKNEFPRKKIGVLFPIERWATELRNVCNFWKKIKKRDISKSQFPDQVKLSSGIVLARPRRWTKGHPSHLVPR